MSVLHYRGPLSDQMDAKLSSLCHNCFGCQKCSGGKESKFALESSPSSVWREHTHEEDAKPMGNDSPFTASATTTHPKEVQESAQGHNLSEYEKSRVSGPNLMCCSGA